MASRIMSVFQDGTPSVKHWITRHATGEWATLHEVVNPKKKDLTNLLDRVTCYDCTVAARALIDELDRQLDVACSSIDDPCSPRNETFETARVVCQGCGVPWDDTTTLAVGDNACPKCGEVMPIRSIRTAIFFTISTNHQAG